MNIRYAIVVTVLGVCAIGCQQQSDGPSAQQLAGSTESVASNESPPEVKTESAVSTEAVVDDESTAKVAQSDKSTSDATDAKEKSYWKQVTEMYESAKSSGRTTASNVNAWIIETYDQASSSTKETAAATADWFNNAYEQAKESGETTAANTRDWLIEDVKKMGSWEYKTIVVKSAESNTALARLNELGAKRWECFWVDKQGDQTTFYLKKAGRSFLRQLPARELLHLLPLLNKDNGAE